MIQPNLEDPINLGTIINTEYSKPLGKSALKEAFFKVGMKRRDNDKVRLSHNEPIIPAYMPARGLEIMGNIESELRELWGIMCDPEQYYDRTSE